MRRDFSVRAGQSNANRVIGRIVQGTVVQAYAFDAGWALINLGGGRVGWVEIAALDRRRTAIPRTSVSSGARTKARTVSKAAVWRRPNVSDRVGTIPEGTFVTVIRRASGWAEISLGDGTTGWIDGRTIGERGVARSKPVRKKPRKSVPKRKVRRTPAKAKPKVAMPKAAKAAPKPAAKRNEPDVAAGACADGEECAPAGGGAAALPTE